MTDDEQRALDSLRDTGPEETSGWKFRRSHDSGTDQVRSACRILESSAPEEVLPDLFHCFWYAADEAREILGALVLHLASRLPLHLWPKVDDTVRRGWGYLPQRDQEMPSGDAASVLVGACHPSGRVREAACHRIDALPPQLATSLLLVRVNDWVRSITDVASASVSRLLRELPSSEKIPLAPLVLRLQACGRFHHFHWRKADQKSHERQINRWQDLLAHGLDPEAWRRAWLSSRGPEARAYLTLLKHSGAIPGVEIRRALLLSNDRAALLWYLHDVLPRLDAEERAEAIRALAGSRAVPVRRQWLTWRIEEDLPGALEELKAALVDRSRSLRHFARYYLSRLAPMDFAGYYESLLLEPATEARALIGLTEVAPATGHREALRRLGSESAEIRKSAIECLDPETLGDHLDFLLRELNSAAPGPAKAARKQLGRAASLLGLHLLGDLDGFSAMPDSARQFFIRLAPSFGKWHGLEFLLRVTESPPLNREAKAALGIWQSRDRLGRSFVRLPQAKRELLLQLLPSAPLDEKRRAEIQFILEHSE